MSELKEYTVDIAGIPHTVQLSEEDAKRQGAKPAETKAAAPANKARTAQNKAGA